MSLIQQKKLDHLMDQPDCQGCQVHGSSYVVDFPTSKAHIDLNGRVMWEKKPNHPDVMRLRDET